MQIPPKEPSPQQPEEPGIGLALSKESALLLVLAMNAASVHFPGLMPRWRTFSMQIHQLLAVVGVSPLEVQKQLYALRDAIPGPPREDFVLAGRHVN